MKSEVELLNEKNAALEIELSLLKSRLQEVHKLFHTNSTPILITTFDDNIRLANSQAVKFLGFSSEENLNKIPFRELLSNSEPKKWDQQKQILRKQDLVRFELKISVHGTKSLDVELMSMKLEYQGENCIISYLRDITAQKIAEKKYIKVQEQHDYVLDSIPAMVFVKDGDNRIISINRSFEEITGVKSEDIIGKSVFDLMDNMELAEKYWKDDLEVIETGVARRNITEPLFTDPNRWFLTDKIPFNLNDGESKGIIGFSVDITERKHAEEALIRSEKKFRLLFDTAPDGIVLWNLEGNFLAANSAFLEMLDYSLPELIEIKHDDILPQKWIESTKGQIDDSFKSGYKNQATEKEFYRKDGTTIPVLVSGWVMLDENKKPFQLGAYVKDLTVLKKAEQLERELLQKDKEQLERDLATKDRELNTKVAQLIQNNELVNGVIHKLEDLLKLEGVDKNKQIRFIINGLLNRTNEDLWMQFEITFGQVHPSFYDDLYEKFPNLTPNERKLSAFLKMNLSTKDISSITHQTIRSIEVARFRLRKKMDLPRSTNLTKYLSLF